MPEDTPGSTAVAEEVSTDQGFSEFNEDFPSAGEPTPAPVGGESTKPKETLPGEPPATPSGEPSAPAAPTTPTEKKYRVDGRELTVAELAAAGYLDRLEVLRTKEEQVAHFQRLYEQSEAEKARLAAEGQQAAPIDTGPTTEQLLTFYGPSIQAAVQQGIIEPDVAEAYPKTAARLFHLSDLQARQGKVLEAILQEWGKAQQAGQGQAVTAKINQLSDSVAGKGGLYAPLGQEKDRTEFFGWLAQNVNPPVGMLTEEFVARMWAAFKSNDFTTAASAASQAQKAVDDEKRRMAAGESSGTRPAAPPAKTKLEKALAELNEDLDLPRAVSH